MYIYVCIYVYMYISVFFAGFRVCVKHYTNGSKRIDHADLYAKLEDFNGTFEP